MTDREALFAAAGKLSAVTDEAETEAGILLEALTGRSAAAIRLDPRAIGPEALRALSESVERRLSREPLQYVLGEWYFMALPFTVTRDALIPRQETEILCEEALRLIKERGCRTLLDICTGTGCIAIALAKHSGICAEASDVSPACVALAGKNAERNGVFINVREADLFSGAKRYDVVTANPPYICDADMLLLQEEVRREPELALRGGADGLDFYRRIAEEAAEHINPGGVLLLEVGMGEAHAVAAMFKGRKTRIIKDYGGIERVVAVEF